MTLLDDLANRHDLSYTEIAERHGYHPASVAKIANKHGLSRSRNGAKRQARPCVWCGNETTATDRVCPSCAWLDDVPEPTHADGLTDGRWIRGPHGVLRWQPDPPDSPGPSGTSDPAADPQAPPRQRGVCDDCGEPARTPTTFLCEDCNRQRRRRTWLDYYHRIRSPRNNTTNQEESDAA